MDFSFFKLQTNKNNVTMQSVSYQTDQQAVSSSSSSSSNSKAGGEQPLPAMRGGNKILLKNIYG